MKTFFRATLALSLLAGLSCRQKEAPSVVVYTALDRLFSEPILTKFEQDTGIKVLAKYDTESTKTIGLVNALRAERGRPRCDVFWNNEIVNTLRLKEEGLLSACQPASATSYPAVFRDPEGFWFGFAGRARVFLVNTDQVLSGEEPSSLYDLADPKWKGRAGMAKPLFGTTATHVACLFSALGDEKAKAFLMSVRENQVHIESGNKTVALGVSEGRLAFGLTDTDDAIGEVEAGKPVKIVYPDSGPDQMGVLFIPNTLSLMAGAPHREAGIQLIDYLLSPEVEALLARAASSQIPLNPLVKIQPRVKTPSEVKPMEVDFSQAAREFESATRTIQDTFLE